MRCPWCMCEKEKRSQLHAHIQHTNRGIKAQVADIAWDDLFFLQGLRNTKRVVYHRLLHRVHLREGEGERHVQMITTKNKFLPFQLLLHISPSARSFQSNPKPWRPGTFPWHPSPWEPTPHHNDSAAGRTSICFRASRMFLLFIRSHPWPAGTLPGQYVCECMCLIKSPIV